jgi:hypothetical protein
MATMTLVLPRDARLDWHAMAVAVTDVRLERLWDTGDDTYPWEGWLWDVDNLPGGVAGVHRAACRSRRLAQLRP